jgi:hypothetical protein
VDYDKWVKEIISQIPQIEHCSEPKCAECNIASYQGGRQAGQESKAESLREEIMIEIQKDLDAGGFYRICSNESSFKHYVSGLLSTPNNKQNG